MTAWLRHAATVPMALLNHIERGPFRLDPATQEVWANGREITLTNLEFRLLHLLITHTDQVLASQVLLERVWHYDPGVEGSILKNAIYRLRRKIEPDPSIPQYIITVSGESHMFKL